MIILTFLTIDNSVIISSSMFKKEVQIFSSDDKAVTAGYRGSLRIFPQNEHKTLPPPPGTYFSNKRLG